MVESKQGKQVTKEDMEKLINEQPKNKARLRGVRVNIVVVVFVLSSALFVNLINRSLLLLWMLRSPNDVNQRIQKIMNNTHTTTQHTS